MPLDLKADLPLLERWLRSPHVARWASLFEEEAARIRLALGAQLLALHHIGSTAIPGIVAKPVIDMLAVVTSVEVLDDSMALQQSLQYEALGEFGIPGRRYFRKNSPTGIRTHHLHAFAPDAAELQRHLDFRDYLRSHPETAQAYDALKRGLAARHSGLHNDYTDGKTDFIRDVERRARLA